MPNKPNPNMINAPFNLGDVYRVRFYHEGGIEILDKNSERLSFITETSHAEASRITEHVHANAWPLTHGKSADIYARPKPQRAPEPPAATPENLARLEQYLGQCLQIYRTDPGSFSNRRLANLNHMIRVAHGDSVPPWTMEDVAKAAQEPRETWGDLT